MNNVCTGRQSYLSRLRAACRLALMGVLILPLLAHPASAVYKCAANGRIAYQSMPCDAGQSGKQPAVGQLNADRQKQRLDKRAGTSDAAVPAKPVALSPLCDGRQFCSQMTSCAEAKSFLANCPNVKMDGNRDGIPCEKQWCSQ